MINEAAPDADIDDQRDSATSTTIDHLPILSYKPKALPGCCLALSLPLLDHLCTLLSAPDHQTTISIGSGYGLLEALLRRSPYLIDVIGVEVEPSPNRYLPAQAHRVVYGSRFLEALAAVAATWLFIYPRRPGLLKEYMAQYGADRVDKIIWIGPQVDWEDYASCFGNWNLISYGADTVGGRASELITVAQKG